MAITQSPRAAAHANRHALAQQILRQAEAKAGVNREFATLEGFYEQAASGVCGALGIPVGAGLSVASSGSTALLLAMVAEVMKDGEWVAVVGMPTLGMAAAAELGIDLSRLVLVGDPGAHAPRVLAALIDGFDAVVIGRGVRLNAGQRRSLLGRARGQRTTIFSHDWPESSVRVEARVVSWRGVGYGEGYVRERDIDVRKRGHGGERTVRLSLKGGRVAVAASTAALAPATKVLRSA